MRKFAYLRVVEKVSFQKKMKKGTYLIKEKIVAIDVSIFKDLTVVEKKCFGLGIVRAKAGRHWKLYKHQASVFSSHFYAFFHYSWLKAYNGCLGITTERKYFFWNKSVVKWPFRKVTQMLLTLREKYTKLGSHKSLIGICVKRLDRVKTNSH